MKLTDKITDGVNNFTIKMQNTTINLQKQHIQKQKSQIQTLEKLVKALMKQQGYNRAQVFAAIHTGQLVDNDIPKT